jgi:hypothetical protein
VSSVRTISRFAPGLVRFPSSKEPSARRGKPIVRSPDATLRQIAEDTGGRYVYAETGEGLSQVFASMVEELHQQYILGFTPAQADGRLHSLLVTTRRPNVTIRARKHYLAPISAQ